MLNYIFRKNDVIAFICVMILFSYISINMSVNFSAVSSNPEKYLIPVALLNFFTGICIIFASIALISLFRDIAFFAKYKNNIKSTMLKIESGDLTFKSGLNYDSENLKSSVMAELKSCYIGASIYLSNKDQLLIKELVGCNNNIKGNCITLSDNVARNIFTEFEYMDYSRVCSCLK